MRLLLDQCLPRSTVHHLASLGIAADHTGELGMERAADADILAAARQRKAVVVTLDADFHALLATSGAASPSVIRIRIERLNGEQAATILLRTLAAAGADIEAGAVVTVTSQRIRVRRLPIAR